MPIIFSIISHDHVQNDGLRRIREEHTDQLGVMQPVHYVAEALADVTAVMLARVPRLDAALIENEEARFVEVAASGDDLVNIAPDHSTKKAIWKRVLREYRRRDARYGINLLPLLQHINANFNDTQIKDFLGITQARLDAIRSRALGLATLKPNLEADDALIEAD